MLKFFLNWLVGCVVLLLIGTVILYPQWLGLAPHNLSAKIGLGKTSWNQVIRYASPATVSLYSEHVSSTNQLGRELANSLLGYLKGNKGASGQESAVLGSGVLLTKEGYFVTDLQLVENLDRVFVVLDSGQVLTASMIVKDKRYSLAIMQINSSDENYSVVNVAGRRPELGDMLVSIGRKHNSDTVVSHGMVGIVSRPAIDPLSNKIVTDIPFNQFGAGGGVFNDKGDWVGLVLAQNMLGSGYVEFLPAEKVFLRLQKFLQQGDLVKGWLGVEVQTLTASVAESLNASDLQGEVLKGVVVTSIYRRGPVGRTDIQAGDVITQIDGLSMTSKEQFVSYVENLVPKTKLSLSVLRAGQVLSIALIVGRMPTAELENKVSVPQ
jgi:serine protease DegS